jgi:hypothetical protein
MARGFESKDVEFQQSEANRRPRSLGRSLTPAERDLAGRRRTVELALTRIRAERGPATNPAHREMLDRAIQDLEDQLSKLW